LEHREELLTIAEISIGIAGFSGVMAAFLQSGGLFKLDRVRFVNLFAMAFSTLTLAYVPIVVFELSQSVWLYSSAVMIAFWFFNMGLGLFYVFPELRAEAGNNGKLASALIFVPSFLNLGTQTLNVMGWLWEPNFLAYLLGLFVYLYAACLMFVFIVLYRPVESDAPRQE
jgi:hypothetical protein